MFTKFSPCLLLLLLAAAAATVDYVHAQFGLPNPVNTVNQAARPLTTTLPIGQITNHIQSQQANLGSFIGADSNAKLSSLFPAVGNLAPAQIANCYNQSIGGTSLNIFENSPFDIINAYYKEFPENFDIPSFQTKAANMFKTFTEIADSTVKCVALPPALQTFKVGLNQLSDWSLAEFKKLMGARLDPQMGNKYRNRPRVPEGDPDDEDTGAGAARPAGNNNRNRGGGLFRFKRADAAPIEAKCFPKSTSVPASLDYKSVGKVTPVKFQGSCGSCWAFSSIAALESAYLIQGKTSNAEFDLSEQQLVACANPNFCNGGTSVDAYNFMLVNKGVTDEKIMTYDNSKKQCETKKKKRFAKIKDYCLRGIFAEVNGKPEVLTDQDIQAAIQEFGVVYSTIYAEDPELKNFKSGVYNNAKCSKETNHAINIVGWDADAWIVRNSWGRKWGEDGFFRMKRGENLCGINTYITYPLV